ncbi:Bicyclomycin resistance protein [Nymphon striatum]|nr:Bicyclomycin resistance protein [Nymphon striatum]
MSAAIFGAILPDLDLIWFYFVDRGAFHHHLYWVHVPVDDLGDRHLFVCKGQILNAPTRRLSQPEFIVLIAANFAMVAFSIDSMLPALPDIAQALSPDAPNRAQLVLTSFVLGMGIGTMVAGPLSDAYGRKPVIFAGALLFIFGAILAGRAQTLDAMIASRVIQGLGVAGPRIVTLAIVRDQYEGRPMASIMSYAMMIFTLVIGWLMLRQPETLPRAARRPFDLTSMWAAAKECFSQRVFVLSTGLQVLAYGMLFACLSSTQQIFETTYGRADEFPLWFAMIALIAGTASILNAKLVINLGMQKLVSAGFGMQIFFSSMILITAFFGPVAFSLYIIWTTSLFFMVGLIIGNLNALAMEPVGHIAGLAASVIGAVSTVLGVAIAVPVGLAFDGSPLPLAFSTATLSLIGFVVVRRGLR